MIERLKIAFHPATMRNAIKYALVVGPILVMINHGDAILHHQLNHMIIMKMILTMLVPYLVATFASTGVIFKMRRGHLDHLRCPEEESNAP